MNPPKCAVPECPDESEFVAIARNDRLRIEFAIGLCPGHAASVDETKLAELAALLDDF